jgi:hypothetical protein
MGTILPLARSLLDDGFYDNSVIPNPPNFNRPEVAALLERGMPGSCRTWRI